MFEGITIYTTRYLIIITSKFILKDCFDDDGAFSRPDGLPLYVSLVLAGNMSRKQMWSHLRTSSHAVLRQPS